MKFSEYGPAMTPQNRSHAYTSLITCHLLQLKKKYTDLKHASLFRADSSHNSQKTPGANVIELIRGVSYDFL